MMRIQQHRLMQMTAILPHHSATTTTTSTVTTTVSLL